MSVKKQFVLFVVPPSPYSTKLFLQQPIGVLYTVKILEQQGYQSAILDLRLESSMSIEQKLSEFAVPDLAVVVTSTYDLTQCYAWQLTTAQQTIESLKKLCRNIVVIGAHGSLSAKLTLKELKVGKILTGEFEVVVPQFLDSFRDNLNSESSIFQGRGRVDLCSLAPPDFSKIPILEYKSYVPLDTDSLQFAPSGLLFANRGCPFSCAYCYTDFFGGTNLRLRPVNLVVEEMRQLLRYGIEYIFFLDYTFTAHHKWLKKFLEALKEANLPLKWGCQTRANVVNAEMLSLMAEVGCRYIWYGIESPNISMLNQSKPITLQKIENALQLTLQSGIVPMAFLLVGFPGEDIQHLISWTRSQPFIFSVDQILPRFGTTLFKRTHISIDDLDSWAGLQAGAKKLVSDSEVVLNSYQKMKELPNYFENKILH